MRIQLKTIDYFKFSPVILLLWSLISILFIPIIPIASGFGWDGIFYGKVGIDFQHMIGNMDNYHAGRIFPGVLIHYFLKLIHANLDLRNVLLSYQMYYCIIIVLSSLVWVNISNALNIKELNKWVGFIALFINYPVLNWYFYYPPLTDGTALFIGILMLYSYITHNNFILLSAIIVSFFSWPTGIVIGLFLFIYSNFENKYWVVNYNKIKRLILLFCILSPVLFLVLFISNEHFGKYILSQFITYFDIKTIKLHSLMVQQSLSSDLNFLFNSLMILAYFIGIYWMFIRDFDFFTFIKSNFQKGTLLRILIGVALLITLIGIKSLLFNPTLETVTAAIYLRSFLTMSIRFPFQFIICNTTYWGPTILLLIIFGNDVITYMKKSDFAIMLGLLFTILFSINAEGRAITNFYPFIVYLLIKVIDFDKFKNIKYFVLLFLFSSLLFSKIWLPIKLPMTAFPEAVWENLDKFPMQKYFMNFGLWVNKEMYILHSIATIVFFALYVVYFKRNLKSQKTI